MERNDQDTLNRAYAMLKALQNSVAELQLVKETYVRDYHTSLDMLEGMGIDVTQFRIPPSELQPRITSARVSYPASPSPPPKYSNEKYVTRELLLTKLDATLNYLEITYSQKPRKIGFSPPDES